MNQSAMETGNTWRKKLMRFLLSKISHEAVIIFKYNEI